MQERIKTLMNSMECNDMIRPHVEAGLHAALEAGAMLKGMYHNSHEIRYKGRIDMVTEADIASEQTILEILGSRSGFPVMAEESGITGESGTAEHIWIVDPLDGTTNFAHGFQVFAVSIALARREDDHLVPEIGMVYSPMQDELFWAVEGCGARLEEKPLKVSMEKEIGRSLIGTGFPYAIRENLEQVITSLANVMVEAQGIRRAGAAAVDLAWVAAGRLDGFYEIALKPWDVAAGTLLVKEAGGMVTDFSMNSHHPEMHETLATNGHIHDMLAPLVKKQQKTTFMMSS